MTLNNSGCHPLSHTISPLSLTHTHFLITHLQWHTAWTTISRAFTIKRTSFIVCVRECVCVHVLSMVGITFVTQTTSFMHCVSWSAFMSFPCSVYLNAFHHTFYTVDWTSFETTSTARAVHFNCHSLHSSDTLSRCVWVCAFFVQLWWCVGYFVGISFQLLGITIAIYRFRWFLCIWRCYVCML